MRVRLEMTVEVDPEAWALEYGVEPREVREDVRTYFAVVVNEWPATADMVRVVRS